MSDVSFTDRWAWIRAHSNTHLMESPGTDKDYRAEMIAEMNEEIWDNLLG